MEDSKLEEIKSAIELDDVKEIKEVISHYPDVKCEDYVDALIDRIASLQKDITQLMWERDMYGS